jgi:hypothetical protein
MPVYIQLFFLQFTDKKYNVFLRRVAAIRCGRVFILISIVQSNLD